ncbi:MMPL family transporter [Microbacteriaceae bacterium 4G12]
MPRFIRSLAQFSSSSKGAKIVLAAWIVLVLVVSMILPSSKQFSSSTKERSVKGDTPSAIAAEVLQKQFPSKDGLPALLVFHRETKITSEDREKITALSKWLASDEKPKHVASSLPFHQLPPQAQDKLLSQNETTLLLNLALEKDISSKEANETLTNIKEKVKDVGIGDLQFEITGPAGIAADTTAIFKNADLVLMLATVGLIFILLIVIYRSPLLAITPLLIAAIVYEVVDRILGLAGKNNWFAVDSSAVSIMLVLLFAVLTDYSLFIFSRYRNELQKHPSKYSAMKEATWHVSEPILFSGGTVLFAVLTLFVTVFEPYNHFAPVFSVAMVVILCAGLTLIPSIFALLGRKAFWPFIPKQGQNRNHKGIWQKVSELVIKRPKLLASVFLVILLVGAFNVSRITYSFNLLKSFPEDMSSRKGFELLEKNYPAGELAPVTIVLESKDNIDVNKEFLNQVKKLEEALQQQEEVSTVTPAITDEMIQDPIKLPKGFLAESKKAAKLQLILQHSPYDVVSIDAVKKLREQADTILKESNLSTSQYSLHIAGQTAEQVDVRSMNTRDTIVLFSLVTLFIMIMLGLQTRSIVLSIVMVSTILLSYAGTLGFGWFIFQSILGYDAISYRLPVYTFVFMVALGVDYNIMLVSRIKEEASKLPWREAVGRGVALTGGVISSAGVILAATFAVLMTQPLQELFLFGVTMALGIMLDTFLVRGLLLPSLMILLSKGRSDTLKVDQKSKPM